MDGVRRKGGASLISGFYVELWEPVALMLREKSKGQIPEGESTDVENRGGATCSSDEVPVMGMERRGCIIWFYVAVNQLLGGAVG
jgi:hypothetical protein